MGLPFHFSPGEGPVIEKPVRTADDVKVSDAPIVPPSSAMSPNRWSGSNKHFGAKMPVIGFCGAPFTLASYMVEGGRGDRLYVEVKKLMSVSPRLWDELVGKLVERAGCVRGRAGTRRR